MSRAGSENYKGVTYQAWAAMLLFLLRIKDSGGFESIVLEDKEWEDFTLLYRDGKKIICESKFRGGALSASQVKTILNSVLARKSGVKENDEILIICPKVSEKISSNLKYITWFPERIRPHYAEMGFTKKQIDLLAKTTFFEAESAKYLYDEVSIYFRSLVDFWLPDVEIEMWIKAVFVDQILNKSVSSEVFSRADLEKLINDYRQEKIKQSIVYDREKTEIEKQVKGIVAAIKSKDTVPIQVHLTALTAQPQTTFILLDTIFASSGLKLEEWNFLWESLLDRHYAFRVIHEFKKHVATVENASYVVNLFTEKSSVLTNKALERFHGEYALGLVRDILQQHPSLNVQVLEFCQQYLSLKQISYFDLEGRGDVMEEKSLLSTILLELFKTIDDPKSRLAIINLIELNFGLVEDDGDHSIYTPPQIFELLNLYIGLNFNENFGTVLNLLVRDFNRAKYYKKFNGWELSGGMFNQSGNSYSVADRHFIKYCLKPSLVKYYEQDKERGWNFIVENCIAIKVSDVSAAKPDFLGRASIPILLKEFSSGTHSGEAFTILKKQMFMRRGIPSKYEIIFQELNSSNEIPDDKKWLLVKAYLEKYGLPNSVFVEQVVSTLAMKGHEQALNAIKLWVQSPDYRQRQNMHTFFISQSMFKLLETSPGSVTYAAGVDILKAYLATKDFTDELDTFHAYDITKAVARVIEKDFDAGVSILREINQASHLTKNQQLTICHSIEQLNKDDVDLLSKIYQEFLRPIIFTDLKADIHLIEKRFPDNYARSLIVQFAEHMAEKKLYVEALELTKIFMNDSNPRLENDPNDDDGTFNYHAKIIAGDDNHTINTVRGWCAWVLQKFCILPGRDYLEEVTDLVIKLSKDENLYIRTQATFPLTALVQNRHTFMPDSKETERFISLRLAAKIEKATLDMLDANKKYPVVMKYVLHALSRLRTLSEDQAWHVFDTYKAVTFEQDFEDIYGLLVYYAYFRKDAFKHKRLEKLFGKKLYNEINSYDDTKLKKLLEDSIHNGSDDARSRIAWQFWQLPKDTKGNEFEKLFAIALHNLKIVVKSYSHHAFEEVYYFIKDYMDRKPNECLELWVSAIEREKEYLDTLDEITPGMWWPSHYNGMFLTKLKEAKGDNSYLAVISTLLSYPTTVSNGIDPDAAYNELNQIGTEPALKLLKELCDQIPSLYSKHSK